MKTTESIPEWFSEITYAEEEKTDYPKLLIYGAPGTGKTNFLFTTEKPFIIDLDGGLVTGKKYGGKTPSIFIKAPRTRNDRVPVYDRIIEIIVAARDRTGPFAENGELADRKTICLDGYTLLADALKKEILLNKGLSIESKAEYDTWATLAARLDNITELLKQVPMIFVGTAGKMEEKDEAFSLWTGYPDIVGGYRRDILYRFDEVYYFDASKKIGSKTVDYVAHTVPYRMYTAKTRVGLPPLISDPSWPKVQEALQKGPAQ